MAKNDSVNITVIGANGSIGRVVSKYLVSRYSNLNLLGNKPTSFNTQSYYLGEELKESRSSIHSDKRSYYIILAGLSSQKEVFMNPEEGYRVNVHETIKTLDQLKNLRGIPIFISSEAVFGLSCPSSRNNGWTEKDNVCPVTVYGKFKVAVEDFIKSNFTRYIILRSGWIVNRYLKAKECVIQKTLKSMLDKEAKLSEEYIISLTDIDLFNYIINYIIENNMSGVYHVTNAHCNRVEIGEIISSAYLDIKKAKLNFKKIPYEELKFYEQKNPRCFIDSSFKLEKSLRLDLDTIVYNKIKSLAIEEEY